MARRRTGSESCVTIAISAGAGSEQQHRFDPLAPVQAALSHLPDLMAQLSRPVEVACLPDPGQGGEHRHGLRLGGPAGRSAGALTGLETISPPPRSNPTMTEQPAAEARFSRCGRYRWWLRRRWRPAAPTLVFLGLNPSSADGQNNDPTLRRLIGFAGSWGYGAVEVLNLFSWISTDPLGLRQAAEPVGHRTDAWIRSRMRQLSRSEQEQEHREISIRGHLGSGGGPHRDQRRQPGAIAAEDAWGAAPHAPVALWLGWGTHGGWRQRDQEVLTLLSRLPVRLFCLGLTAGGQPRHPLYARAGSPLLPFGASWERDNATTAAPCPAPRAATRST